MANFLLTFAGVPFVSDQAERVEMPDQHEELKVLSDKQQPLPDLMDEIDRLIPFHYLQDFATIPKFPGRNLTTLAGIQDQPKVRIGEWYYPVGASRWSVFRGLATSSQVKAMLAVTGGKSPSTFLMKCDPSVANILTYTLNSQMYMLPPRPLAEHGAGFDGLYLVTLVDERYYWQFRSTTLHVKSTSTWVKLIEQLADDLGGVSISFSAIPDAYAQPEPDSQLWVNAENPAILLDAVAANIGCAVVRALNGTYKLQTPQAARTSVIDALKVLKNTRMVGGDIFNSDKKFPVGDLTPSINSVIPSSVNVTFPKYVLNPIPHFVNSRYPGQRPSCWYEDSYGDVHNINIPITSGGNVDGPNLSKLVGIDISHTIHTTAKALYQTEVSGNPLNASGLTSQAMLLAENYYGWQVNAALDEVFPGTFAWLPDALHDIVWTYSERRRQASTRIMRRAWDYVIEEMQHSSPALSGSTSVPVGIGGPSVAQTIRDSWPASGAIKTTLIATLNSGDMTAQLNYVANLPTLNRWRGLIDNEIILFEGTGNVGTNLTSVNIVYRAIDGTLQPILHNNGATVTQLSDIAYGVNLTTYERGQFIYPAAWTSGGISEVRVIPQIQSIVPQSTSGTLINNVLHYLANIVYHEPTRSGLSLAQIQSQGLPYPPEFTLGERVFIKERNLRPVLAKVYEGQFAGYTAKSQDGLVAPVYLVGDGADSSLAVQTASGTTGTGLLLSGRAESVNVLSFARNTGIGAFPPSSVLTSGLSGNVNIFEVANLAAGPTQQGNLDLSPEQTIGGGTKRFTRLRALESVDAPTILVTGTRQTGGGLFLGGDSGIQLNFDNTFQVGLGLFCSIGFGGSFFTYRIEGALSRPIFNIARVPPGIPGADATGAAFSVDGEKGLDRINTLVGKFKGGILVEGAASPFIDGGTWQ